MNGSIFSPPTMLALISATIVAVIYRAKTRSDWTLGMWVIPLTWQFGYYALLIGDSQQLLADVRAREAIIRPAQAMLFVCIIVYAINGRLQRFLQRIERGVRRLWNLSAN